MLNIKRRPDVDSGFEKLFDILPAFLMTTADGVRVGEFIDQQQVGTPGQGRINIEISKRHASILVITQRKNFETIEQRFRFLATVWFNITHDNFSPCRFCSLGIFQHRIGFPDTGRIPEEHLQRAACGVGLFGLYLGQQFIRIRTSIGHGQSQFPWC